MKFTSQTEVHNKDMLLTYMVNKTTSSYNQITKWCCPWCWKIEVYTWLLLLPLLSVGLTDVSHLSYLDLHVLSWKSGRWTRYTNSKFYILLRYSNRNRVLLKKFTLSLKYRNVAIMHYLIFQTKPKFKAIWEKNSSSVSRKVFTMYNEGSSFTNFRISLGYEFPQTNASHMIFSKSHWNAIHQFTIYLQIHMILLDFQF